MKKRIMIVGPTQAGKSTLANALNNTDRPLKKTQDVIYGKNTIDTPGSYIENASMYKYLIATAQTASHVLLLLDSSKMIDVYPPGFAKTFNCPVIGIITKTDAAPAPENIGLCIQKLVRIGVTEPYYQISFKDNSGVDALRSLLLSGQS